MAKKVDPIKEAGLEVKLNTPVGIGQYAYLETPDFEYNSAGDWKVKLFLDPNEEDVKSMMTIMDELMVKAMDYFTDKAKTVKDKKKVRASENTPYYFETNDEDEPTGRIFINPKSLASGKTKEGEEWKRYIPIFDSQGVKVTEKLNIGNGTKMRVSMNIRAYFNVQNGVGLSLRMTAIQIIDLKKFGGGIQTAEDAGFEQVEGGYSSAEEASVELLEALDGEDDDSSQY